MKQVYCTAKTPEELEQMFLSKTEVWSSCRYRQWVPEVAAKRGNMFYGSVKKEGYRIIPLVSGKNFLTPVFSGEIKRSDGELTRVTCFVQDSPFVRLSKVFLLSSVLILIVFLAHEYTNGSSNTDGGWFMLSCNCMVFIMYWRFVV